MFIRKGLDGIDIGFGILLEYEGLGYAFESSSRIIKACTIETIAFENPLDSSNMNFERNDKNSSKIIDSRGNRIKIWSLKCIVVNRIIRTPQIIKIISLNKESNLSRKEHGTKN
ncbi:hypothetical protein N9K77_00820 [bacterium]|nr:hypothetical protein [bacterium]